MKAQPTPIKEEVLKKLSEPILNGRPALQLIATECRFEVDWSIDALAVDSVGRLTLIFFGPKEEESWLLNAVDAISWIERNRKLVQDRFQIKHLPEALACRTFLIASEFSPKFLSRLATLQSLDFVPIESRWAEVAGEKRLRLRQVWETTHTNGKAAAHYSNWALEPQGATFLRESIEKIVKIDPEIVVDWGSNHAQLVYRNALLALLVPDDKGLQVFIPGEEKSSARVNDHTKLVRTLDSVFRLYLEASSFQQDDSLMAKTDATSQHMPANRLAVGRGLLTAEEVEAITK